MTPLRLAALSASLAFGLTACGGGSHSGATPPSQPPQIVSQPVLGKSNFAYDLATLKKATYVGPATNIRGFGIDVQLRLQNEAGLSQLAAGVSDPKSANYRRFLTPAEIGQRFGASQSDVAAARKYFAAYGVQVTDWPQHMMLHVAGSLSQLAAAFHTTFGIYKLGKDTIIGPATTPSVGVGSVIGSGNIVAYPARFHKAFATSTTNHTVGYTPQQVAAGFDYNGAYAAGFTGTGVTIGVIGTGPVAISGVSGITTGDVEAMRAAYHVRGNSKVILKQVGDTAGGAAYSAGGFVAPPPVSNAGCGGPSGPYNPVSGYFASEAPFLYGGQWCNPEDIETQIDTEAQALLAPDATVDYYLAYNPNDYCGGDTVAPATCPPGSGIAVQGIAEGDAEIQQAIAENAVDAISISYGESEYDVELYTAGNSTTVSYQSFLNAEFAALAVEGIATFVSSADTGANECNNTGPGSNVNGLCVSSPASDPSVVSVGGVTIPLDAAGALVGPITAWGVQTSAGGSGSGGGVSILNPTPYYQSGISYYVPGTSPAVLSGRGVPDLSLLGDPATGVSVFSDSDSSLGGPSAPQIYGGTSVAAPEMAAMWALVLQACKNTASCNTASGAKSYRLGNPNPILYKLYGNGTGPQYATTFYNVQYGTNSTSCAAPCMNPTPSLNPGYFAGPGYNLVTGIGVPYGRALIKAVVGV
jgi:subtilase family serine protease